MNSIKWQAPEFDYRKKDVSWYWMSIIVSVLILAFAVWQKNFPFGFFIVIAEIMVLIWASTEPPIIDFELNEGGISIGEKKFRAHKEFANFSIDEERGGEWSHVFFQFHNARPRLKIKIPAARIGELRQALKGILPEIKHEHSLVDAIEELIGF